MIHVYMLHKYQNITKKFSLQKLVEQKVYAKEKNILFRQMESNYESILEKQASKQRKHDKIFERKLYDIFKLNTFILNTFEFHFFIRHEDSLDLVFWDS